VNSIRCLVFKFWGSNINGRILKANLSRTGKKSNSSDAKNFCLCLYLFYALKAKLQIVKFEFCQVKLRVELRINLQLTGKMSLKLDSNSSLLLEYGCKYR